VHQLVIKEGSVLLMHGVTMKKTSVFSLSHIVPCFTKV